MKRYDMRVDQPEIESIDGDWVRYDDYLAIDEARDELSNICISLTVDLHQECKKLQSLEAKLNRLRGALLEISECSPQKVLNLKAKVGDKQATGYNYQFIARKALEGVSDER